MPQTTQTTDPRLPLVKPDNLHCKHGCYTGHEWGPDYMCGWCEDSTTDEQYLACLDDDEEYERRRQFTHITLTYISDVWQYLVDTTPYYTRGQLSLAVTQAANLDSIRSNN